MYLTGSYYHALEQKGRVSVPKKFRQFFKTTIVLTLGLDGCLFGFHPDQFQKLLSEQEQLPLESKNARDWTRLLTNNAAEIELDALGRILIPENLRLKAGIHKEIVIVGSLNRIEIWDQSTYHRYLEQIETNKEQIAEAISQSIYDHHQSTQQTPVSHAQRGSHRP